MMVVHPAFRNLRYFSISCPKTFPRRSGGSSFETEEVAKWKNYVNRKTLDEGGDLFHATNFGNIRLDSINKKDINQESPDTIGRVNIQSDQSNDETSFYLESDNIEVESYKKIDSRLHRTNLSEETKLDQKITKDKNKDQHKSPEELRPVTMKAYQFLKHLRDEEFINEANASSQNTAFRSKEEDVAMIGQSLQSRIDNSMSFKKRNSTTSEENEDYSSKFKFDPQGRVIPKFLPTDLSMLSSIEVIKLLQKSVIYDKSNLIRFYRVPP